MAIRSESISHPPSKSVPQNSTLVPFPHTPLYLPCLYVKQLAVMASHNNRIMVKQVDPIRNSDFSGFYHIRLKGHLGPQWMDWFDGLQIKLEENGDTLLSGTLPDQAALHGIFKKIRDTGMTLLSVNADRSDQPHSSKFFR